ncbi:peptidase S8 [Pseudomonas alkylphenolica]|uniref:Peptidase S8 n=1 Tax=Pseudomonas alkylphenolica TaxID=237609 RepID=A0A443ZHI2_9PSED|nr:S8 family serine peptidase [Pseudomonas alkylphenolica]RWU18332.1 peptidase S8 [Pseudomonas alkylphenolica]
MSLDISFAYFRNFRFDGQFHVRCSGNDLCKVKHIYYSLERLEAQGPVPVDGITVLSQSQSGALEHHGCPATLASGQVPGTYHITPQVTLTDEEVLKRNLPHFASGELVLKPLIIVVGADESSRSVLDKVPLPASAGRRRRDVADLGDTDESSGLPVIDDPYGDMHAQLPVLENGERFPPLLVKFIPGGVEQFLADLEPDSYSILVRQWPNLKQVLAPQSLLSEQERQDSALSVLRHFYVIEQPEGMSNEMFVELIRVLAPLDYLETLHFAAPQTEHTPFVLAGAAAVVATLITGVAVAAGNHAYDEAQPTPDFEALQTYLDQPGSRHQGMNIRKVWEKQVVGSGVRVHFSDGGLHPNHEDLRGNPDLNIISHIPNTDPDHGTASVGLLVARANSLGMSGICHASELYVYNNRATKHHNAQTPKDLLRYVRPGDIVGINRQTANINAMTTFLPSLHDQLWWDATRQLTERGAVVVNAACNGSYKTDTNKRAVANFGVDLSEWPYFLDHGDADAILIGACHSWDGKPHQYSNYNYRYRMLNSWGDSVATLGYGALQDKDGNDRDYTDNYGGTSSATPLVTGALALIQSYAIEHHHVYLNANQMHLLVMESGYKDATLPHTDVLPMGARPDVHGALVLLDRILGGGKFHTVKDEL